MKSFYPRASRPVPGVSLVVSLMLALAPHMGHAEVSSDARAAAYEIEASSGSVRFYNDALTEESRGQFPRARQSLELALSVAENEKNIRAQAVIQERLARVLEQTQQTIAARSRMEKACELRAKARDEVGELVCLEHLGPMYLRATNANKAQSAYERLRKLARKYEDSALTAETWLGTGKAATLGHRIGPAQRDLAKAMELFQKEGAPDRVAEVYIAQAELARLQEKFEESYALGLQAQALLPDNTDIALLLIEDALVMGRPEEVLQRLGRLPASSLPAVQQLQLQLVALVIHAANANQQALDRSNRMLFDAYSNLPAAQETPPSMAAVKRFIRQDKRMNPMLVESLNGLLKILGAEHTSVSELALKKQLEVVSQQLKASLGGQKP